MTLRVNQVWLQQQTARQVETGYASITLKTTLGHFSRDVRISYRALVEAEHTARQTNCELTVDCALRNHPVVLEYFENKKTAS